MGVFAKPVRSNPGLLIFCLSASTPEELTKERLDLIEYLIKHPDIDLTRVSYSLSTGRKHQNYRYALIESDYYGLISALKEDRESTKQNNVIFHNTWFTFSEGQKINDEEIHQLRCFKPLKDLYDRCYQITKGNFSDKQKTFIYQYGMYQLFKQMGIATKKVIGNGIGKFIITILKENLNPELEILKVDNEISECKSEEDLKTRLSDFVIRLKEPTRIIELNGVGEISNHLKTYIDKNKLLEIYDSNPVWTPKSFLELVKEFFEQGGQIFFDVLYEDQNTQIIKELIRKETYELSHAQRRLWISWQLTPDQIAYNLPASYRFKGNLDIASFRRSFHTLIERHEILRTRIVQEKGDARQEILLLEDSGFDLIYEDLRGHTDREALAMSHTLAESCTIFRLDEGSLFRARLLQIEEEEYLFVLTMHHIISDGWSMEILVNEILQLYSAFRSGKANPLEPLAIQYKDYAHWQNRILSGESLELHRSYWLNELSGTLPELNLPTDHIRPEIKGNNADSLVFYLENEEKEALNKLSESNGATLFMVLLALVKVLLYRYTSQTEIMIGIPVAGREHLDLENQIGFYINTIPVKTKVNAEDSISTLIVKIKEKILSSYEHQIYPFDQLIEDLDFKRDRSRFPLVDVIVVLQNTIVKPGSIDTMDGILIEDYQVAPTKCVVDLRLEFTPKEDGIIVRFDYDVDLFDKESIVLFKNAFFRLVEDVIKDPFNTIDNINLAIKRDKTHLHVKIEDSFDVTF